jgi:hypothetical protein
VRSSRSAQWINTGASAADVAVNREVVINRGRSQTHWPVPGTAHRPDNAGQPTKDSRRTMKVAVDSRVPHV